MVKVPSLVSTGSPSAASEIRTRHCEEGVAGTVQRWVPSFSVEATIVVQVDPLSAEYSIFTGPTAAGDVQAMECEEPASQLSPPFGEDTESGISQRAK